MQLDVRKVNLVRPGESCPGGAAVVKKPDGLFDTAY